MTLSDFRGAYDVMGEGPGGTLLKDFSPLVIHNDGAVFLGGQQANVTFEAMNPAIGRPVLRFLPPFGFKISDTQRNLLDPSSISFIPDTTPSRIEGLFHFEDRYTCTLSGRSITVFSKPTLDNAIDVSPAFDTGEGLRLQAGSGNWITVEGDRVRAAGSQKPDSWFRLTKVPGGFAIGSEGQYWVVDAGLARAVGATSGQATPFKLLMSLDGGLLLQYQTPTVGLLAVEDGPVAPFSAEVEMVQPDELLRRRGIETRATAITPCEQDMAALCWQLTGGLFFALGLGPYMADGEARVGVMGILRSSPRVWEKVMAVWTAVSTNRALSAIASAKLAMAVLQIAYAEGVLWLLVKFLLRQAGWWIVFKLFAWVASLLLAPELEAADLIASYAVWQLGLIQTALAISHDCGNSLLAT
jgi:hypothetical protein